MQREYRYGVRGGFPKGQRYLITGARRRARVIYLGVSEERYMRPSQNLRPEGLSMPAFTRLLLLCPLLALTGCGEAPKQSAAPPPPAVTVAKPVQRTIVDQDEYVGRFVAVDMVEVRARLSGYLSAIQFKDGQMVKQGDPLFTIDRRPFEIALEQM